MLLPTVDALQAQSHFNTSYLGTLQYMDLHTSQPPEPSIHENPTQTKVYNALGRSRWCFGVTSVLAQPKHAQEEVHHRLEDVIEHEEAVATALALKALQTQRRFINGHNLHRR